MDLGERLASFLALLATGSFLTFYTPIARHLGRFSIISPDLVLEGLKGDPFIVATNKDDFLDGHPTRSSGSFWGKVCLEELETPQHSITRFLCIDIHSEDRHCHSSSCHNGCLAL